MMRYCSRFVSTFLRYSSNCHATVAPPFVSYTVTMVRQHITTSQIFILQTSILTGHMTDHMMRKLSLITD
jgi:hypothetical protein